MGERQTRHICAFDTLFTKNVPHILENIFLSLDYESFKTSLEVSKVWKRHLTSDSFQRTVFLDDILNDEEELLSAAEEGNADEVRRLLSSGLVDANRMGSVERVLVLGSGGRKVTKTVSSTPLCEAARGGHIEVVELLLEYGAKTGVLGEDSSTPLHLAASKGHTAVVKLLLDKGANSNCVNEREETPLYKAAVGGYVQVVKLLLDRGADIQMTDKWKNTPLHLAARFGHKEVAKLLLDRGAQTNSIYNSLASTPLHEAAICGQKDIVKMLLDEGADPKIRDFSGKTPLFRARLSGRLDIVDILMKYE